MSAPRRSQAESSGHIKSRLPNGIWNKIHRLMPPPPPFIKYKIEPEFIQTFKTRVDDGTIYVSDE
ncbi:MAG: hypothetical protein F4Z38_11940 [Chloroflexi bacterium]|nr:hypothetical protein [Chloroflexota bacterium]